MADGWDEVFVEKLPVSTLVGKPLVFLYTKALILSFDFADVAWLPQNSATTLQSASKELRVTHLIWLQKHTRFVAHG